MSFNDLSDAEAERLALLLEELGEAQQAIGKILRHGYESTHPDGGPTNREALERELGDVLAAADLLYRADDLCGRYVEECRAQKHAKVQRYLHHQPATPSPLRVEPKRECTCGHSVDEHYPDAECMVYGCDCRTVCVSAALAPSVSVSERPVAPRNQCDGCARGLPVNAHGLHETPGLTGLARLADSMACTADRYQSAPSEPPKDGAKHPEPSNPTPSTEGEKP